MKGLISIVIGLLVVGYGKKSSKPETNNNYSPKTETAAKDHQGKRALAVVVRGTEESERAPHGKGNVYAPDILIENGNLPDVVWRPGRGWPRPYSLR